MALWYVYCFDYRRTTNSSLTGDEVIDMRNTWTDTIIQGSMVMFCMALGLLAFSGLAN